MTRTQMGLLALAAALTAACQQGRGEPTAPTAVPLSRIAPPSADPAAAPGAGQDAPAPIPAQARPLEAADPPSIPDLTPWFDTRELRRALKRFERGENRQAAQAFEAFAAGHPDDPRALPARFMGLLARHDAGDHTPAAERLEAFARQWPLMADYATFYAGSAHAKAGRHARAAELLGQVPGSSTLRMRAAELEARMLVALGQRDRARAVLEEALTSSPSTKQEAWKLLAQLKREAGDLEGSREAWLQIALRFPDTPSGEQARKVLDAPRGLTPPENLRLARALAEIQAHRPALASWKAAAAGHPRYSDARCEALVGKGRTLERMKRHSAAWRVYDRALGCKGEALAMATFRGGRNRLRAGAFDKADELLTRHLEAFPEASTADDAAVMLAAARRGRGDERGARALLRRVLREWPDGDMVDQAAWDLVAPDLDARRWGVVSKRAREVLALAPRETHYRAEGRLRYWLARSLQRVGQTDEARKEYQRVLAEHPLSWYATLAYSRLHAMSPAEAARTVERLRREAEPPADPLARVPGALWGDVHFRKAVALARMGLGKSARRELGRVAKPQDEATRRAWTWSTVAIYDLAGAPARSTRLARLEEPRFGAHWPAGPHRRLWELAHPLPYRGLVEKHARERGVDPFWVWSIMREESGFNPRIVSWANAIGLMQIIPSTARLLARRAGIAVSREKLKTPSVAVNLGTLYLSRLLGKHGQVALASAGYNAGGGAVAKWRRAMGRLPLDEFVERIPYDEARGYAKRVTRSLARYTWLYGGERMLLLPLGPVGAP